MPSYMIPIVASPVTTSRENPFAVASGAAYTVVAVRSSARTATVCRLRTEALRSFFRLEPERRVG